MFGLPGVGCGGGAVCEMMCLSCGLIILNPGDSGLLCGVPVLNPAAQTFQFGSCIWAFLISSGQIGCCTRNMELRTTLVLPEILKIFNIPEGPVQFLERGKNIKKIVTQKVK